MNNAENTGDQMQSEMTNLLTDRPLPTGHQINATVALLNLQQRSHVLIYVTQYLCTDTEHYPANAETIREAYAAAFAADSITVVGESE
jgi:hypothetical protein